MPGNSFWDLSARLGVPGVKAGISLRYFPYSSPDDRRQLAKLLDLSGQQLIIPHQVHSPRVVVARRPGRWPETDGVITDRPDLVPSVQVADCIPLFLVDPENDVTGLIHAGWRGIVAGIVPRMLETLRSLGCDNKSLRFLLGPSIQQCCFEVGPELKGSFPVEFTRPGREDRTFVDLSGIVMAQLLQAGIRQEQVVRVTDCTHCSGDRYHSYRRDGTAAGRMVAVIGWDRTRSG
jgi:hypothetical protein